jgi:hypothetical protein
LKRLVVSIRFYPALGLALEDDEKSKIERLGEKAAIVIAAIALLILIGAGLYAIGDAVLAPTPVAENPGFVDTVLASRAVVAAVRIAIIAAAVYIVISAVWLVANGRFLIRVGPVHVSEQVTERVSGLDDENSMLRNMLQSAGETIEDLQDELAATNEVLAIIQKRESGSGE